MAKLDKVKEEIGWIRAIFGIILVTDISLIAWLIQNYDDGRRALLGGCLFLILILIALLFLLRQQAYRKINSLEDL